jgi:hypothetical protein
MIVQLALAALAGGTALFLSKKAEANTAPGYVSPNPVGYRRLMRGDRVTAAMVIAQKTDLNSPVGVHNSHAGFMTGVENPNGQSKQVAIFVPVGTEYLR